MSSDPISATLVMGKVLLLSLKARPDEGGNRFMAIVGTVEGSS